MHCQTQNSKENVIHVESITMNKTNVPTRINQKKKKETRDFWASAVTAVRWGISLETAGNIRLIKTRGARIGTRKKTWNKELQT